MGYNCIALKYKRWLLDREYIKIMYYDITMYYHILVHVTMYHCSQTQVLQTYPSVNSQVCKHILSNFPKSHWIQVLLPRAFSSRYSE